MTCRFGPGASATTSPTVARGGSRSRRTRSGSSWFRLVRRTRRWLCAQQRLDADEAPPLRCLACRLVFARGGLLGVGRVRWGGRSAAAGGGDAVRAGVDRREGRGSRRSAGAAIGRRASSTATWRTPSYMTCGRCAGCTRVQRPKPVRPAERYALLAVPATRREDRQRGSLVRLGGHLGRLAAGGGRPRHWQDARHTAQPRRRRQACPYLRHNSCEMTRLERPTMSPNPFIRWTYDKVGNRLTDQRPTGTTSYSHDRAGRLLGVKAQKGASVLADIAYTRDPVGNPLTETRTGLRRCRRRSSTTRWTG